MHRFRQEVAREYAAFAANLLAHLGQRTDILGALEVAGQEFAGIPESDRCRLIVLSDFLEDDGRYRFTSIPELANPARARDLAVRLGRSRGFAVLGARLYLGGLESRDFAQLGPERRVAVQAFWSDYFA